MDNSSLSDLTFNALRNALYHSARRGYFDGLTRWLNFFVVAAGTAAIADLQPTWLSSKWLVGTAAAAALVQLVFDLSGKARTHEFLQRRFYELLAEISEKPNAKEQSINEWNAAMNRLYSEEPPAMRALGAAVYNSTSNSLGLVQQLKIKWYQRIFRQVFSFGGAQFPPV